MPKPYTVCSSCCVPGTISTWVSGLGGDAKDLGWTALQTPRNQTPRRSTMICPPSLGHGIPMPVQSGPEHPLYWCGINRLYPVYTISMSNQAA